MKQFTFLFITVLCFADIFATCVVETPSGLIKGTKLKSRSGKVFDAFNGIPYAEAPVGDLRFRNPVPKKAWDKILHADHERCECPQLENGVVRGCEDCLHLSVYSPETRPDKLYPVLVFIHDSAFILRNSSKSYVGPDYLLDESVVYVALNYRLNALGFLSTGDDAASGNFGLKDQALALQWVKNNIKNFGGDPNEVTLFGNGAGSESASFHALSSLSQNLFKRLILQSGTCLSPNALAVGPSYYEKGKKLAELLKCPTKDSHKMVDCLRKLSPADILKVSYRVFDDIERALYATWRPTPEKPGPGAFLTDTPEDLIQKNKWKRGPLIIGSVKDEGTLFSSNLVLFEKFYEKCRKNPVAQIKEILKSYPPLDGLNITAVAIKLKNHYIGVEIPKSKEIFIKKFTDLMSDYYLFISLQLYAYLRRIEPNRSYAYLFDYHGTITSTLIYSGELHETGVGHTSDIYSEFPTSGAYVGPQFASLKRTAKDYKIIDILINFWATFAKNSVPTSNKLSNPHLWQPQRNSTRHLKIGDGVKTDVSLEVQYRQSVQFWFENVPQYCLES